MTRSVTTLIFALCIGYHPSASVAASATSTKIVALTMDTARKPVPRYHFGHVVSRELLSIKASRIDATGKSIETKDVVLPEASAAQAVDAAVAPDGAIAIAASVTNRSGQVQPVIVWFSPAGDPVRVVSTENYATRRLSFSADGSLWTVGRKYDSLLRDVPEYDLLRQYDSSGKLIRSALPRASFSVQRDISPASDAFLVISGDRVGIFSVAAGQWVKLSGLTGAVLETGPVPSLPGALIIGVAMGSDTGDFFITAQADDGRNLVTSLYRLNRDSNQFEEVNTSEFRTAEQQVTLLGSDNAQLVLRVKPGTSMHWVSVEDVSPAKVTRR